MIRKILCWLGFHKWELYCGNCSREFCTGYCKSYKCKHCGKTKK